MFKIYLFLKALSFSYPTPKTFSKTSGKCIFDDVFSGSESGQKVQFLPLVEICASLLWVNRTLMCETHFSLKALSFSYQTPKTFLKSSRKFFFDEVQLARRKAKIGVKKKFLIFQFKNFFSRFLKKIKWGFWTIKIFCNASYPQKIIL